MEEIEKEYKEACNKLRKELNRCEKIGKEKDAIEDKLVRMHTNNKSYIISGKDCDKSPVGYCVYLLEDDNWERCIFCNEGYRDRR